MLFNKKGFTLIEVMVAMGIFVLMIGSIIGILVYSFRSRSIVWEQLSTQNEGRKVLQDFINELRTATQSSIGAYAITAASDDSIIFYSNIDSDSWRERVRYYLSGTILKKGIIKPTGNPLSYDAENEYIIDVAHDISNGTSSVFYYYGEEYDGVNSSSTLSNPIDVTKIRVVGIKLRMEEDPNLSPAPFIVEGKVEVRNLKTN